MSLVEELRQLADRLDEIAEAPTFPKDAVKRLEKTVNEFAKAASGSWLGYHANIYYKDFRPPSPGALFSMEWGFMDNMINDTVGDWARYAPDYVREELLRRAEVTDLSKLTENAEPFRESYERIRLGILSIISRLVALGPGDQFLASVSSKVEKLVIPNSQQAINVMRTKGAQITRDSAAASAGVKVPPHIQVYGEVLSIKGPFKQATQLAGIAIAIADHVQRDPGPKQTPQTVDSEALGSIASGGQITVNTGPVYGGLQIASPNATQSNNSGGLLLEAAVEEFSKVVSKSILNDLEKEEALLTVARIGELCRREPSLKAMELVDDKLEQCGKIVAADKSLCLAARHHLALIKNLLKAANNISGET